MSNGPMVAGKSSVASIEEGLKSLAETADRLHSRISAVATELLGAVPNDPEGQTAAPPPVGRLTGWVGQLDTVQAKLTEAHSAVERLEVEWGIGAPAS